MPGMAAFSTVQAAAERGVMTITLSRPDALNAMNEASCAELGAALRMAQQDEEVRCIVLTGRVRVLHRQDLKSCGPCGRAAMGLILPLFCGSGTTR